MFNMEMFKKKKNIVIGAIVFVLVLVIILRLVLNDPAKRFIPLQVVIQGTLTRGEMINAETLTGDILPVQQAIIYPKVNGNIEKIFVDIGDRVSQNQTLALIDTTIYSQNAKLANANLIQAEANYENSKINYDRNKNLLAQNLISKQDYDNAKTALDVTLAQKEAANANYTNAVTQLNYCKIKAPFTGSITKRFFDAGAYVTVSSSSPGSNLFMLMDINNLKSLVNIPEKDVPLLNKIIDVNVLADALPGKIFKAKLKKISEAVDLATRTMAVEIDIDNSEKLLKPGMFATIILIFDRKENSLTLPNQVVLKDDGGNYIYLIKPDTTVSKKYIQVGIQYNNKYEILSGVNENDKIVFVGQNLIKDHAKVKIIK
jgi:RND family efflux transporter MFP subunit